MKRDIDQLEEENKGYMRESQSGRNVKRIIDLIMLASIKDTGNKTKLKLLELNFEKIEKATAHATEEGCFTKRSTAVTDREFLLPKNPNPTPREEFRYDTREDSEFDISFHRWAKELHINDDSMISLETAKLFSEAADETHHSIEDLIDELREEYKLSEADVTQLRIDVEKTPMRHQKQSTNGTFSEKIDRETIKSNMFLSLINQKLNKISTSKGERQKTRRVNSEFCGQPGQRHSVLKQQRMGFDLNSTLFGKLLM